MISMLARVCKPGMRNPNRAYTPAPYNGWGERVGAFMPRKLNPNNYYGWHKLVLERDKHQCVLCGSTERLEVDHILPYSKHRELAYTLSNGRTLCRHCHKQTPTYGGKLLKGTTLNRNPYGQG